MKRVVLVLLGIVLTALLFAGCDNVKETMSVDSKDTIAVGIIGENPVLANVSIDMIGDFAEAMEKRAEFNDIKDDEVLNQLKEGNVDIAITFKCAENDKKLSMCKIFKKENDSLCILMRREDVTFRQRFESFMESYEKDGGMEKTVKKYISSPNDFMPSIIKPFKFD